MNEAPHCKISQYGCFFFKSELAVENGLVVRSMTSHQTVNNQESNWSLLWEWCVCHQRKLWQWPCWPCWRGEYHRSSDTRQLLYGRSRSGWQACHQLHQLAHTAPSRWSYTFRHSRKLPAAAPSHLFTLPSRISIHSVKAIIKLFLLDLIMQNSLSSAS